MEGDRLMADEIPAFDPTKPFDIVSDAPPFDPDKPFEPVETPSGLLPGRYYDPLETQIAKASPYVANVMAALGEGAGAAFQERLVLSDESRKFLEQHRIIAPAGELPNPFQAFNNAIITPLA